MNQQSSKSALRANRAVAQAGRSSRIATNALMTSLTEPTKDHKTAAGGDTSAPLGAATDNNDLLIPGKRSALLTRNDKSTAALKSATLKHQLWASRTDFESKGCDTWSGTGKWGGRHQVDSFLASASFPRKNALHAKRAGNASTPMPKPCSGKGQSSCQSPAGADLRKTGKKQVSG